MPKASTRAALGVVVVGTSLMIGCRGGSGVVTPDFVPPAVVGEEGSMTQLADARLPFHSEMKWGFRQVPVPAGRCTEPLPPGLVYLWMTELSGTAESTHLGSGAVEGSICIYGQLTEPAAPPPDNGVPFGWQDGRVVLTAANGDQLKLTARSTGVTAPPGTPGFKFIEEVRFVDGGTGRFQFATGEATGYVDPVGMAAVYDGWIRYGRQEK